MWCVGCKTTFSWKTGVIQTGAIHNPEYFRWMREQGKTEELQRLARAAEHGECQPFHMDPSTLHHACIVIRNEFYLNKAFRDDYFALSYPYLVRLNQMYLEKERALRTLNLSSQELERMCPEQEQKIYRELMDRLAFSWSSEHPIEVAVQFLLSWHRFVLETRAMLYLFEQRNNRDIHLAYLVMECTKAVFEDRIIQRDRQNMKRRFVRDLIDLLTVVSNDILQRAQEASERIRAQKVPMEALRVLYTCVDELFGLVHYFDTQCDRFETQHGLKVNRIMGSASQILYRYGMFRDAMCLPRQFH
jgi:hypothetical protein